MNSNYFYGFLNNGQVNLLLIIFIFNNKTHFMRFSAAPYLGEGRRTNRIDSFLFWFLLYLYVSGVVVGIFFKKIFQSAMFFEFKKLTKFITYKRVYI